MTEFVERQIMFSIDEAGDGWTVDFCVCEGGSVMIEKSMEFRTKGSFGAASFVVRSWLDDLPFVGPHYSWDDLKQRRPIPR